MPRPKKTNIDYFPLYCCYDERIALAEAEQGIEAFYVYIKLLMRIYGGRGYYLEWEKKKELLFAKENHISYEKLHDVIEVLIEYDLFDADIFRSYGILTSKEIQEHYFYAVSRRRLDELDDRILLVNVTETKVNVAETPAQTTETPAEATLSTQRKEKEIKENKSIENESRGGVSPSAKTKDHAPAPAKRGRMNNVILTDTEYQQLKASYPDIDSTIERMSSYMASTGKTYYSHYATLLRWAEEDKARGSIAPVYKGYAPKTQTNTKAASRESEGGFGESYDFDEFFAAAVRRGQNLYPISPENGQNEGVPNGTLH